LHVIEISIAGATRTNGGQALQQAVQAWQWPDLRWLWCPVTPWNTPPLLSWVTTVTVGVQSHGLNELHGHFVDIYEHFVDILHENWWW